MKEISEISWQVSEPEYRSDPALSQSTIGKYERGGFESIPTLFDKESSSSLTFGSLVDELLTGTEESFKERFCVAEFPKLEPKVEEAVKAIYESCSTLNKSIYDISEATLKTVLDGIDFYKRLKDTTRFEKVLTQDCAYYYSLLKASEDKELINSFVFNEAKKTAKTLKSSEATFHYFRENSNNIKRYYQLKFKGIIDGVEYRGMLDLVIVDYEHKVVIPCDLKTTSSPVHTFWKNSFLKWRYDIQARLYWRLLRMAMDKDEYFKDFELKEFRFIVINKDEQKPLIWRFKECSKDGDLELGRRILRAPWDIGKELRHYLDDGAVFPDGINPTGINDISDWLNRTA